MRANIATGPSRQLSGIGKSSASSGSPLVLQQKVNVLLRRPAIQRTDKGRDLVPRCRQKKPGSKGMERAVSNGGNGSGRSLWNLLVLDRVKPAEAEYGVFLRLLRASARRASWRPTGVLAFACGGAVTQVASSPPSGKKGTAGEGTHDPKTTGIQPPDLSPGLE